MAIKKTKEQIIKEKTTGTQNRDFSDKAGPVLVQMSMDDCKKACKDINVEYKKGYESRVLRYVCSDATVDRMGDVIKQEGWKLENFKKNPVVMGFHDYSTFPVGNALSVGVIDGKLKMNILFIDKEVNEEADKAFKMAKSGFMRAGSVGFNPIKHHQATAEEQKELGLGQYGIMFEEQELMEFSVCGVPANANAIQESISKGMMKKKDFQGFVKQEILDEVKDVEEVSPTIDITSLQTKTTPFEEPTEVPTKKPFIELDEEKESELKEGTFADLINELVDKRVNEALAAHTEKAGAVLSKKSKALAEKAVTSMKDATELLEALILSAESSKEEPTSEGSKDIVDKDSIIEIYFDDIDDPDDNEALYSDETLTIEI